ncbi:type IV toxin-antitoxin system AbiEi family antitoxin domain-containing protein [Pseudonocardia kunmingensis]|uniref:Very-short-patch-repair endonuclease n=1 Tax=Pseudonocardia kunmingensis TaxID=630975 RepID=A0A543DYM1_9PSEU|nr:type IV toxin-antitoxin system AbiEi family antitoxin domain-containing protein [Pseudonocardia kunmingensis]TQM14442.1 very-short-patch-repair endonuclease [Pseudonocardia kunmingensis]
MSLERVLVRQAGVVTRAQALACGLSADTVRRRVRAGVWRELHPCVYLVGGHRLTDEARVRAASLWGRAAGAAVTGPAAAFWHGMLDRAPGAVELTLPRAMHRSPRPGVALRRRDLPAADLVEHRGVAVATPPLAALETAIAVPRGSVFLDRALQRHVRFPAVYRSYCRTIGRQGSAAMHRMLVSAADRADSEAERLLVRLLRAAGIDGWVLGHPFGPYLIDLAFPAERVAIEVDGWAWHMDAERFRADRRKGNALTRGNWDLLRYPWHALDGEPDACIAEILETRELARRRPA